MWGHMFFVSSILLGNDAMWTITKMFEGYFFFGRAYPVIVSGVVAVVLILFIAHAGLAVRKFPINYAQYRVYRDHMGMMHHEDTTLWWWQVVTGFAMFFLASVHLYQMLMHPGMIGPFESADRVWSGSWWPLYLVLLFCVELHGGIGLYRLAVKWGWFAGKDAECDAPRPQAAEVGAVGVLHRARPHDARRLHEDRLRTSGQPRRALYAGVAADAAAGTASGLVAVMAGGLRDESRLYRGIGDRRRPRRPAHGCRREASRA